MPSSDGSEELHPLEERAFRSRRYSVDLSALKALVQHQIHDPIVSTAQALTTEEQQAIVDGEPYCFRCGKPASSFPEYAQYGEERFDAKDYVLHEEGTYNPETNRFACDACYIAIGMPVGEPNSHWGWKAP